MLERAEPRLEDVVDEHLFGVDEALRFRTVEAFCNAQGGLGIAHREVQIPEAERLPRLLQSARNVLQRGAAGERGRVAELGGCAALRACLIARTGVKAVGVRS